MSTPLRLAAAAVIGALAIGAIFLNLPGRGDVGGPSPTPSETPGATETIRPSPTPVDTPATSSAPSPSASRAPFLEPGDPIPDDLLGAWYDAQLPAFPWLLRAGDPYCVVVLDSTQDCTAWQLADGNNTIGYETIATIVDGRLTFYWLTGSCVRNVSHYDVVRGTDTVTLRWASGSCVSGDYTFVRPGTNGAPTAPPQPAPN